MAENVAKLPNCICFTLIQVQLRLPAVRGQAKASLSIFHELV